MLAIKKYLIFSFSFITLVSCKKDKNVAFANASLNVVNVSAGVSNAQVMTPNVTGFHSLIAGVNYKANAVFTIPAGNTNISLYNQADTTKPFYTSDITSNSGDIYSLFIGGAGGKDIVISRDNLNYYVDSSVGVRFVNMSYNSSPVNVVLSNSNTVNEFGGIAYKSITDFKKYSGSTDVSTFQVTDGAGTVLASADVSFVEPFVDPRIHHNVTLVFYGVIGNTDTSAPGMLVVNNY